MYVGIFVSVYFEEVWFRFFFCFYVFVNEYLIGIVYIYIYLEYIYIFGIGFDLIFIKKERYLLIIVNCVIGLLL